MNRPPKPPPATMSDATGVYVKVPGELAAVVQKYSELGLSLASMVADALDVGTKLIDVGERATVEVSKDVRRLTRKRKRRR